MVMVGAPKGCSSPTISLPLHMQCPHRLPGRAHSLSRQHQLLESNSQEASMWTYKYPRGGFWSCSGSNASPQPQCTTGRGDERKHFTRVGNRRSHVDEEQQALQQKGCHRQPCEVLDNSMGKCNESRNVGSAIPMLPWVGIGIMWGDRGAIAPGAKFLGAQHFVPFCLPKAERHMPLSWLLLPLQCQFRHGGWSPCTHLPAFPSGEGRKVCTAATGQNCPSSGSRSPHAHLPPVGKAGTCMLLPQFLPPSRQF